MFKRGKWLEALFERIPAGAEIDMEACASVYHWARGLGRYGYRVRMFVAHIVKPYVKSNKNDRVDAEVICEAMSRTGS